MIDWNNLKGFFVSIVVTRNEETKKYETKTRLFSTLPEIHNVMGMDVGDYRPFAKAGDVSYWILPRLGPTNIVYYEPNEKLKALDKGILGFAESTFALTGKEAKGFLVMLDEDWEKTDDDLIKCMGRIFRDLDAPQTQKEALEKLGIPFTEELEATLNAYIWGQKAIKAAAFTAEKES